MSKPLYLYFTRPDAYEVYMGGKRSVTVWLQQPQYRHSAKSEDYRGRYSERGWSYDYDHGKNAKPLFKQDPDLLELVWDRIVWSLLPKGMSLEEGLEWYKQPDMQPPRDDGWGHIQTNYHWLFEDRNWEAKCNLCHKRFVLQVDVRGMTSEFVSPMVELPDGRDWVITSEITPHLASRYWVPQSDGDIPF